ncbi:MAG: ABC transporter permease, partial [Sideroxyarcus sp.]|nr:ABC transporter permease [Sideroxyarcus sp.]
MACFARCGFWIPACARITATEIKERYSKMKLRDFKIGFRLLIQEPAYSAVVILGLSVGFAACILLLSYVRYSWNYDTQVPDVEQVMVVKIRMNFIGGDNPHIDTNARWWQEGPVSLVRQAMEIPGIADATASAQIWAPKTIRIDDQYHRSPVLLVFQHFAQMLGLQAIEGNLTEALERPDGLAVTAATAKLWFPNTAALNKAVQIDGKSFRVMAIVPDVPSNSTMQYSVLVGLSSATLTERERTMFSDLNDMPGQVLLRLKLGVDVAQLTTDLQKAADRAVEVIEVPADIRQQMGQQKVLDLKLLPLREAYFDQEVAWTSASGPRGDKKVVFGLAAVAFLVLALAAINYVNLATVRVSRRQREIGMRKVLGADAAGIVTQFFAESLLVSLFATGIGFLLAWLLLPVFSDLINRQIDGFFSMTNIVSAAAIGILVGILSALQPAWTALRVPAAQVLAERPNTESLRAARLRWCLTVLQLATAITLSGVALTIAFQTDYASKADPGFDPRPLLVINTFVPLNESPSARAFRTALERLPGVAGVAAASDAVGRTNSLGDAEIGREGGPRIAMTLKSISPNFLKLYQVQPIAGRVHDPGIDAETDWQNVVINQTAVRLLGFASPQAAIGQLLNNRGGDGKIYHRRVIGVIKDIRHHSMRETPTATSYEPGNWTPVFTVRATTPL